MTWLGRSSQMHSNMNTTNQLQFTHSIMRIQLSHLKHGSHCVRRRTSAHAGGHMVTYVGSCASMYSAISCHMSIQDTAGANYMLLTVVVTGINYSRSFMFHARANFFREHIVNAWNALSDNVDFSSLPRFKRSVHSRLSPATQHAAQIECVWTLP